MFVTAPFNSVPGPDDSLSQPEAAARLAKELPFPPPPPAITVIMQITRGWRAANGYGAELLWFSFQRDCSTVTSFNNKPLTCK